MSLRFTINREDRSQPIFMQIKEQLLAFAHSHGYADDDMLPELGKIAQAAGVSLRTAHQALNALIAEGHGYRRPKRGTFFLATRRNKRRICGLLADNAQPIENSLVSFALHRGVNRRCAETGLEAIPFTGELDEALRFYRERTEFDFRGVIALDISAILLVARRAGDFPDVRFFCLNYRLRELEHAPPNVYTILNDDEGGAYRVLTRFASEGFRRALVVTLDLPESDLTYRARVDGYRRAAAGLGAECDVVTVPVVDDYGALAGRMARRYLDTAACPDAIFATNDLLAAGILPYATAPGGTAIPVVGYDHVYTRLLSKRFSTVEVDYTAIARAAVDALLDDGPAPRRREMKPHCLLSPQADPAVVVG